MNGEKTTLLSLGNIERRTVKMETKKLNQVLPYISKNHHHHHHVVPLARLSQTLPRHFSLSFIASGRSSGLHPVSSHSCCMYVRAGRPAFAWPYAGVHRRTSLMSSSLLLQQCPACLAGAKLVYEKLRIPSKSTKKKSKPGWEIRLKTQIKNHRT